MADGTVTGQPAVDQVGYVQRVAHVRLDELEVVQASHPVDAVAPLRGLQLGVRAGGRQREMRRVVPAVDRQHLVERAAHPADVVAERGQQRLVVPVGVDVGPQQVDVGLG